MYSGTLTVDLHRKNRYQAKITVDAALKKAPAGVYRVRVIHGYHSGTGLRDLVREDYLDHPKVLRMEYPGDGETVLVLRELY